MNLTEPSPFNHRSHRIGSPAEQERAAELRLIIAKVARAMGFSPEIIRGRSRCVPHVEARRAAAVEARNAGYSLCEIGRAMNRDHSTILQLIRKHDAAVANALERAGQVGIDEIGSGAKITMELTADQTRALLSIAGERREGAAAMIAAAVRYTISDNLFAAILDR